MRDNFHSSNHQAEEGDKAYFDALFQWINERGEKSKDWYIYPYFFVKQLQDPEFLKKAQAFDFGNYKTHANEILIAFEQCCTVYCLHLGRSNW